MATDWLHHTSAALMLFVVAAAACALVLTLTRRRWPPTEPRARVLRAVFTAACLGAAAYLSAFGGAGETFMSALLPPAGGGPFTFWGLRLLVIGIAALFFGGLIPAVLEGRTLAQMGWTRRGAWAYAGVALVVAVAFRAVAHPPAAGSELLRDLDASKLQPESFLRLLPLRLLAIVLAEGLAVAFMEENLFRGHLMQSLSELGWRGARANHLQAGVFAVAHPYVVTVWAHAAHRGQLPGIYVGLYLFGLLFGYLRWRTGSIVPGFVFHAIGNAVFLIFWAGPLAAWMAHL